MSPIDPDSYPPMMMRMLIEGTVTVMIGVGPDGHATGCLVSETSGYRELDEATCQGVMRRGRYTPAKDAAGNPVASVIPSTKLAWRLP